MNFINLYQKHPKKLQYLAGFVVGLPILPFAIWASEHGANAGHLVTMLGGTLGTALAIIGTVKVENWKRSKDKKEKYLAASKVIDEALFRIRYWMNAEYKPDMRVQARMMQVRNQISALSSWSENLLEEDLSELDVILGLNWIGSAGKDASERLAKQVTLYKEESKEEHFELLKILCGVVEPSLDHMHETLGRVDRL